MAEIVGHFLKVGHGSNGAGFEVALCGRNIGRLFALSCHPTHEGAYSAAILEAEKRGGLAVEDAIGGGE